MSQFLTTDIDVAGKTARLTGDEAHHLTRVMRVREGETVRLFDGRGRRWRGVIQKTQGAAVLVAGLESLPSGEPPGAVHLIQALLKGDRWEWLLEKAVELGATRITPVVTGHTVARPGEGRSGDKLERWRKRALAAAKQCERGIVPEIDPPVPLDKFLKTLPAPEEGESRRAFLERAGEEPPAPAHPGAVIRLAVGPEGGWTEQEIAQLAAAGFRGAGLGPRILRGETAALAALVLASLG